MKPPDSPAPAVIRATRDTLGLTQTEAAALVYVDKRTWQKWEGGERAMMPAVWELFLLKTGQLTLV
jgi:DNA (cytosine-5)-methyltransferase 1